MKSSFRRGGAGELALASSSDPIDDQPLLLATLGAGTRYGFFPLSNVPTTIPPDTYFVPQVDTAGNTHYRDVVVDIQASALNVEQDGSITPCPFSIGFKTEEREGVSGVYLTSNNRDAQVFQKREVDAVTGQPIVSVGGSAKKSRSRSKRAARKG